uniref:Odorant-binding protein 7 n=1 Tax=Helopeltis theivora TaxID=393766 RepID=A0A6B9S051_9HEMI|nr:odorant-binding protein 7 [Helopeltis theivora]
MGETWFVVLLSLFVVLIPGYAKEKSPCDDITDDNSRQMMDCCSIEIPFTLTTLQECEKAIKTKQYQCEDDCLLDKDGIWGTDKKFNMDLWKEHIKKNVRNTEWANIMIDAPKNCSAFQKMAGSQKECDSGADTLLNCMSIQWYMRCPKSAQTATSFCESLKKKVLPCFTPMFKN